MIFRKKYETPAETAYAIANNKTLQVLLLAHCAGLDKAATAAWNNARVLKNNAALKRKKQAMLSGWRANIVKILPGLSDVLWRNYRRSSEYKAIELSAAELENHAASWKMLGDTLNSVSSPLISAMLRAGVSELNQPAPNNQAGQDLRAAAGEVANLLQFIDPKAKANDNDNNKSANAASASQ